MPPSTRAEFRVAVLSLKYTSMNPYLENSMRSLTDPTLSWISLSSGKFRAKQAVLSFLLKSSILKPVPYQSFSRLLVLRENSFPLQQVGFLFPFMRASEYPSAKIPEASIPSLKLVCLQLVVPQSGHYFADNDRTHTLLSRLASRILTASTKLLGRLITANEGCDHITLCSPTYLGLGPYETRFFG